MRCFAAVELDERTMGALRRLRETLPRLRDVRWTTPEQWHVTLWFFGEVADSRVADVADAVSRAAATVPRFPLLVAGVGGFPNDQRPRVAWLGVDDPQRGCQGWIRAATPLLAPLGFRAEDRPFRPHVTLARARGPSAERALGDALSQLRYPACTEFTVRSLVLFESVLAPGGSMYRKAATANLGS
jgi:2'-5' RNA ligase